MSSIGLSTPAGCAFLRAPVEIRLEIYRYLLSSEYTKREIAYEVGVVHAIQRSLLLFCIFVHFLLTSTVRNSRVALRRLTIPILSRPKFSAQIDKSVKRRPMSFTKRIRSSASPRTIQRFDISSGNRKVLSRSLSVTALALSDALLWILTTTALHPRPLYIIIRVSVIAPESTPRRVCLSATNCPTCCAP